MNILELSEQEIVRRQCLQELRDMGIDPYPAAEYPVNAFSDDIKENFNEDEKRNVTIAGRLMSRRVMDIHHPGRYLSGRRQKHVQQRFQTVA